MNKNKTLLTLGSLLTLSACSFQGANNRNSVQLNKSNSSESASEQGLGGKGRSSTNAPWLEKTSNRRETPESYQRAIDRALTHIKSKPDAMLTNTDYSFSVRTVIIDEAGEETIRLESRYKGRRVMGGDVVVQSKADGSLKKIEKNLQKEIKLSVSGLISLEKARDSALGVFEGELHESVEPEAIIYAVGGEPKEAFEVVLKGSHGSSKHPSELHVFVDARSGEVITKWDAICEGVGKDNTQFQLAAATMTSEDNGTVLADAPLPLDQTFKLHSKPDASKTIYLDFNGHTTTGTGWNDSTMGSSFYSPAYDIDGNPAVYNSNELTRIQLTWQRVANDFAPFDVNVTTQEPPSDWLIKTDNADQNYGIRVIVTSYGPSSASGGGIAAVGSFNSNVDMPVFVYATGIASMTYVISHEVGHSLGLSHDGTTSGSEYYGGHGTGETRWAPIMGNGSPNVTTWDDGSYIGSNNTGGRANYGAGADDLAVITSQNGFGFRTDRVGDILASAAPLAISSGSVAQFSSIETRLDTDCFSFQLTAAGDLDLTFDPYWYQAYVDNDGLWGGSSSSVLGRTVDDITSTTYVEQASNLDLAVELFDSTGNLLARVDDAGLAARLFVQGLPAGTYYLKIDGVGIGEPKAIPPSGYTDYASIGNYWIAGTITTGTAAPTTPLVSLAAATPRVLEKSGNSLIFTFTRLVPSSDSLTVNYSVAGMAVNGTDYTGLPAGSAQTITFAPYQQVAVVEILPLADNETEGYETVDLTLVAGMGYVVSTNNIVTASIVDDTAPALPTIALTVSPSSVSEDGTANLVYTFIRSGDTSGSLLVNFSVTGTAANVTDYTGLSSGSSQTVSFSAGVATVQVAIDPVADSVVEAHETVTMTLLAGAGYSLGTSTTATGTILNDDFASQSLNFTASADTLTGTASANTFRLMSLSDALWSSTPDRIANLNTASDVIDIPAARTKALKPKVLGTVPSLDAAGLAALLTGRSFPRNGAATFTFNSGTGTRTFLAIDDGVSGFNAATDAVIEITGYTGSLSMLSLW